MRDAQRIVAVLGMLAFGGATLLGCSSDQEKASEHLARAEAYQAEGKRKEALLELRSALQLDPKSADTNFRIGTVLEAQEQYGDAAFYYGEAHRLDPSRSDAALALVKLIAFPEPERASALIDGVLAREPNSAPAYSMRSFMQLIHKDTQAALEAALTATELDPNDAAAAHQLGVVHQARIREARMIERRPPEASLFEAAVAAFDRAAELGTDEQAAAALYERARVLATWPDHGEQAEAAYRELVERAAAGGDPDLYRQGALAARLYARQTRNAPLLRWSIEQVVQADPDDMEAWSELAHVVEHQEGDGAGEAVLRRLIEKQPKSSEAHIAYARHVLGFDGREDAIRHLEKVAPTVDAPDEILGFLVDLRYSGGEPEEARALVDRLAAEHPGSPRTDLARAQRMIAEDQLDEAVLLLRELNGRAETFDSQHLLALAEARRGRLPDARQAIARGLEIGAAPQREASLLALRAQIEHATSSWTDLLQTVSLLARASGTLTPSQRVMRAEAQFEVGRTEIAKQTLERALEDEPPTVPAVLLFARFQGAEDPDRARALLEGAVERAPADVRLHAALAEMEAAAGRVDEALARIDSALALNLPEARTASLRALRARALMTLGRPDEAGDEAMRAFQAAPGDAAIANLVVAIYASQGKTDEVIASLEEARDVGALGRAGEELLGRMYTQTGRDDAAIETYERLLAAGWTRVGVKNDLAFLLAKSDRDLDRALELAREAQSQQGENAAVADTLGFVYYRKQLFEPAVQQFRFAIETAQRTSGAQGGPETAGYQYHLGLALRGLDRNEEAIEAFEAALRQDPGLAEAEQALAELRARAGGAATPRGSS
jgi:tetratricopeptide (TPR) repeat protein